ncbi:hypothetical protein V8E36_008304 [Tilletia maclaganii]
MRPGGGATARQARIVAARQDEEQKRAAAARRRTRTASSSQLEQYYYVDPLLSDPFLPRPPDGLFENDEGFDPSIDPILNADVRAALHKKPKLTFDRFEVRSLSTARMDAVRLPDIAQASRNMAVHEAQRRARLKRSAKLLEDTTFISPEHIEAMAISGGGGAHGVQLPAGSSNIQPIASTSGSNGASANMGNAAMGTLSNGAVAMPHAEIKEPSLWKSRVIPSAIAHHRALWLAWVMEHERSAADITLSNDIDAEPCPPWDWCFTDKYIADNLTSQRDEADESVEKATPLRGCSCDDDSCDPATCECFARLKLMDPITWSAETDFAYNRFGRLRNGHFEQCVILECNDSCGCSASCRNRLVQHGRTVPLDVFKTAHCGWGVRAKTMIPKNSFIAAYAGELIDTEGMHERGKRYTKTSTTYQLDIDSFHIRCLTRIGPFNDWRAQQGLEPMDPALEETYAAADEWWTDHDPNRVDPILTVDAGLWGNLTRFFNHSCDPNIDMYPVYTDSQNIMRPYLAFFARRDIPAGQELRFNYNGDLADEVAAPGFGPPAGADATAALASGKTGRGNSGSERASGDGQRGGRRRTWDDGEGGEDSDDDAELDAAGGGGGIDNVRSRQKAAAKERRRQTLLMQQDTASKSKKKQTQDQITADIDSRGSRGGKGPQRSISSIVAAAGTAAAALSSGRRAAPSGVVARSSKARSVGAMMAELVPSGSREVELVDGVKAMVCRCGAPGCKGQVFT